MKNLLSFAFIGLLLMTVFSSCKKVSYSRSEPTIDFFNTAGEQLEQDTVRLALSGDSSFPLKYKINTEGTIKWLYKTVYGVQTLISDGLGKSPYEKTDSISLPYKENGNTIDYVLRVTNTEQGINEKRITIVTTKYVEPPLKGTVIGTDGSWSGGTNDNKFAVYDGNINTFFDGLVGRGVWSGLDLGSSKPITRVRYMCRPDYPERMVGGKFEGANDKEFTDGLTTLHTITQRPSPRTWVNIMFDPVLSFRYVRYRGGNNSFCNVAEVEFY